jgi:REP element-mobilizing transposase RayT
MPRNSRQKSYTKVYHIIIRGINKQDIFLDKQDMYKFRKEVERVKEKYKFEIYAYAFMSNHVHFVMYDKNENLSIIMQSLTVSYSSYFNKKYERVGHLFENRFKSHTIENESYLKNVVRYIHKNPENAGLKPYAWTSYYEYVNNISNLIETEQVMNLFDNNIDSFKEFHKFYEKYQDYDKGYEMVGKIQDDEATKIMKEIINEPNLMQIQNYKESNKKEAIEKILKIEGITKVQVARILGINRKTIEKLGKEVNQKGQITQKETSPMEYGKG